MGDFRSRFGGLFQRPDTPAFWELAKIVSENDRRSDEGEWEAAVGEVTGLEEMLYVADQRAMRLAPQFERLPAFARITPRGLSASERRAYAAKLGMWVDGLVAGYRLREQREEDERLERDRRGDPD